jgi:tRNA(fMet)-specific endonuclease VapC
VIALLDTNAYTAIMHGDELILEAIRNTATILMSAVVVGELEYGFRHGDRYAANRQQMDNFLLQAYVDFVTITRDSTRHYGRIMSNLRAAGTKIPTNDVWIAAHAIESEAWLWTRDKHFGYIEGINIRSW